MGRKITVILGAGASHDCADGNSTPNNDYKPPLTSGLFEAKASYCEILSRYKGAEDLSGELRDRLAGSEDFEKILSDFATRPSDHSKLQFMQIASYLQALLGECTEHYMAYGSTRFARMLRDLEDWASDDNKYMFVTLNYDRLLERDIMRSGSRRFDSLEDYLPQNGKPAVIKLHGCCRWGYFIEGGPRTNNDWLLWQQQNISENTETLLRVMGGHHEENRRIQSGTFYPAISVPLGGLKEFVCPTSHIEHAKQFISKSRDYLIVGMSAKDQSICKLLSSAEKVERIVIANGVKKSDGQPDGSEAHELICEYAPTFGGIQPKLVGTFGNLFAEGGLASFLRG